MAELTHEERERFYNDPHAIEDLLSMLAEARKQLAAMTERAAELEMQKEPDEDQILAMCSSHWVDETVKRRIAELEAENARLHAGDFTEEEFQNLCHKCDASDSLKFAEGCIAYNQKLFGENSGLREIAELREGLKSRDRYWQEHCDKLNAEIARLLAEREAEISNLWDVLARIDKTLRVSAAEYVPAIGDVLTIIDTELARALKAAAAKVREAPDAE